MTAMSNWLESRLLDHVLRNSAMASPVTVYAALFTSDPTDADTGTEVSGGSYARQAVSFGVVVSGETSNTAVITFPTATATWGVITHVGIYNAVSGGNLLFHGPLSSSELVLASQTFAFGVGDLKVSLD